MVQLLLDRGTDKEAKAYEKTPLHIAAKSKKREMMELLIGRRGGLDTIASYGIT